MGKMGDVDAAKVLWHASGGRALRGVAVDTMSPTVGKQILLKPPKGLPLMGSSKGARSSTICFSGSDKSASFSSDVIEKGWSAAVQIHADAFLGTANMPVHMSGSCVKVSEQHLSRKVSEACITQCSYIPMKSFQFTKSKMTLSVDALATAREINNPIRASTFLKSFNPFLSLSLFYVGGVFFRQVTINCVEETSLSDLTSQVQREKGAGAGVAVASAACVELSYARRKKSVIKRDEEFSKKVTHRFESSTTCGPAEGSLKKFRRKLQKDSSCWAIIDKDADKVEDLVGVWELLLQHSKSLDPSNNAEIFKFRRAARFLCAEWLDIVDSHHYNLAPDPLLQRQLISQSKEFLETLSSDPVLQVHPPELAPVLSLRDHLLQNPESNPANLNTTAEEVDNPLAAPKDAMSQCSWSHHDAEVEDLLFAHVNASKSSNYICFHYIGDVVVDRKFSCEQDDTCCVGKYSQYLAARHLIDCLRHRVNPLTHLLRSTSATRDPENSWDSGSDKEDEAEESGVVDAQLGKASPLELLMYIMQASDLPAQIEISKLLLSQRAASLLVLPCTETHKSGAIQNEDHVARPLTHCMGALEFVKVGLQKEQQVWIAEDIMLPRVMFLSDKGVRASHSAIVASRTMQCDFMSQYHRGDMCELTAETPVIEVGVGFISATTWGKVQHVACLAFHVTGPYSQLLSFVDSIADVIVLELEQGKTDHNDSTPISKSVKVLRWQESDKGEGINPKKLLLWGQESYIVNKIGQFLWKQWKLQSCGLNKACESRTSLLDACVRRFPPHRFISFFKQMKTLVDHWDFPNIKASLLLQRSLVTEAQAYFESLGLKDRPDAKHAKDTICVQERASRSSLATQAKNIPILQLFHKLLSEHDATSRRVGIMGLERTVSEKMQPILEDVSGRVDTRFQAFNNDARYKDEYLQAKQEYIEKNVGLVNLWRELCHIFEADATNERNLAKHAAQHLLDGFPLEILDGDAAFFCRTWVESVLVELDMMIKAKGEGKSARIFVLTVMGVQSSGKSTLLNLMFGTQLHTSAGQCTRGVSMQLLPAEREEYDYVLLLDTEGLRSPEYSGLKASVVRDNRVATFGLLPADASVFMVTSEDDSALKEVLPIVLLAFQGSSIAEKWGGRFKSKMVFVYKNVDTNDVKKLKGNKQKLYESLREAAEQVSTISSTENLVQDANTTKEQLLEIVFTDFQVHEDEKKSDVKWMGSLKKGCAPPTDTPEWAYGEGVVELREYIHKRVVDSAGGWKATGLKEWSEHLTRVWDCICSADFEMNFKNAVEYSSYMELQKTLQPLRTEVHERYMEVLNELEKIVWNMKGKEDTDYLLQHLERNVEELVTTKGNEVSDCLFRHLECNVEEVVRRIGNEVSDHLKVKKWQTWRSMKQEEWNLFCATTKESYRRRVEDLVSGVLQYEKVVADYENRCKTTIVDKIEKGEWESLKQSTDEFRGQIFEQYFESILRDANKKHPPMANSVEEKVTQEFNELARQFDLSGRKGAKESDPSGVWDQELFLELKQIISQETQHARQYSAVVVRKIIERTTDRINMVLGSREKRSDAHSWVKETLTIKMTEIQRQWDENHNVAEKLRLKSKPRLLSFFLDKSKGLEATSILIGELQRNLESELEEVHIHDIAGDVASKLGRREWVLDWRVMRNFLDYHLILLMLDNKIEKLLAYVADEGSHFQVMKAALVRQAIQEEVVVQGWKNLLGRVERCMKRQASLRYGKVEVFLEELGRKLEEEVNPKLASVVVSSINQETYKGLEVLDSEFFEEKVPELCWNLREKLGERLDVESIIGNVCKLVRERMEENENCRPRCTEICPRCGSACFHAIGHALDHQKHDCIHQPAGLRHGVWTDRNDELVQETCYGLLETPNCGMFCSRINQGHPPSKIRVPIADFEREYPSWRKPTNNERISLQARECIFFNYQDDLVKYFGNEPTPCPKSKMPHYNHDVKLLRARIDNKLLPMFKDEHAWNQFRDLLKSL